MVRESGKRAGVGLVPRPAPLLRDASSQGGADIRQIQCSSATATSDDGALHEGRHDGLAAMLRRPRSAGQMVAPCAGDPELESAGHTPPSAGAHWKPKGRAAPSEAGAARTDGGVSSWWGKGLSCCLRYLGQLRFPDELTASDNRFGFTGHIFDTETGLYNAKARYYDPSWVGF